MFKRGFGMMTDLLLTASHQDAGVSQQIWQLGEGRGHPSASSLVSGLAAAAWSSSMWHRFGGPVRRRGRQCSRLHRSCAWHQEPSLAAAGFLPSASGVGTISPTAILPYGGGVGIGRAFLAFRASGHKPWEGCVRQRAWRGSGATRASGRRLAICSLRSAFAHR